MLLPPSLPWLKLAVPWSSAARATVDQLDQLVNQVSMVTMASMVSPVPQETVVHQLHQPQNCWAAPKSNAHAKPHQVTLDPLAHVVTTDLPETVVPQVLMEAQAQLALADHPDQPAQLATQENVAPLESPDVPLAHVLVHLVHPVHLANQALLDQMVKLALQERMVALEAQVPPEMLATQVLQANKVVPVLQETPARLVHPAAAITAHQLVWPQVIKHQPTPGIFHRIDHDNNGFHHSTFNNAKLVLANLFLMASLTR